MGEARVGKRKAGSLLSSAKKEGLGERLSKRRKTDRDGAAGAPKRAFTGKLIVQADGVKALDRKFTDQEAWLERRWKEPAPPGGWPKPPRHWPEGVRVDIGRPRWWLPEGWGQGIKTTCAAKLMCFVSPAGKLYYHRHDVEHIVGKTFKEPKKLVLREVPAKFHHALKLRRVAWAIRKGKISISEGTTFGRKVPKFVPEERLFKTLTREERRVLPSSARDIHFAVVSARRAEDERGIRNICLVEAQLRASGAVPVWYVDTASVKAYKALGLKHVKAGGKLVPSRNMALNDAARLGKPCVQVSDDIMSWEYFVGDLRRAADIFAGNDAARKADRLRISPVAAARFLLAKMRAAGPGGPKLAGVYPLGNMGQAFTRDAYSSEHFILGDFFVADRSPVRFDPRFTLKEDYDFTCSHLAKHGAVLRCNRMFVSAIHETNAGGAVSERDGAGDRERQMIGILQEKWPGVFRTNPRRGDTQVIMTWRHRK